jgi:hypothetical protein
MADRVGQDDADINHKGRGGSKVPNFFARTPAAQVGFIAIPQNAMKRTRSDSAASAVKAMLDAAQGVLDAPTHVKLREGDKAFWDGIVRARARDEWLEADLVVAGQLARCQADIEREQGALDMEGSVVRNDRGTQVMNPRVTVLEQLARREMALMRTLRMGGRVAGDARDEAGRRKIQRQSEKLREELEGDELLAS